MSLTIRRKTFKTPRKLSGPSTDNNDAKGAVTREQFERGKITISANEEEDDGTLPHFIPHALVPFQFEKKRKTDKPNKNSDSKNDKTPPKTKGKRGRPKKNTTPPPTEDEEEEEEEKTPEQLPSAKKRGRPPKKPKTTESSSQEKSDADKKSDEKKSVDKKSNEKKVDDKKSDEKKVDDKKSNEKKSDDDKKSSQEEPKKQEKAKPSEKRPKKSNAQLLLQSFVEEAVESASESSSARSEYIGAALKDISTHFLKELQNIPSDLDKPLGKKLKKGPPQQNPKNIELEKKRKALLALIQKYTDEEKQWIQLEKEFSVPAKKPTKPKKNDTTEETTSSETKEFIDKSLKQMTLKVDEVKPVIKEIKELTNRSEALLEEVSAKVHKEGFKDYENMNNAKALFKSVAFSET